MSENAEVSIILPVYNKAAVLGQTVERIYGSNFSSGN